MKRKPCYIQITELYELQKFILVQIKNQGQKFILVIAFFETVNESNHSDEVQEQMENENIKRIMKLHNQKLLSIKISPPIYVESRKKSYQERQNKIKFYEPFQPEMITKHYSKGKGQSIIQNTIDDLYTYFTTATIRHKIYHPFFMLLKFNKAIRLYYNTRMIKTNQQDEKFFYDTQKEIFNNLFSTSCDSSDDPLLFMCLRKPKKQDWPKDIQKIDKFLSNIESTALSYLESSDYPFQIPEEYTEIVYSDQLKNIYTKSYNQISSLQFQMQSQRANSHHANFLYQQQFQELLYNPSSENQSNLNLVSNLSGNQQSPQPSKQFELTQNINHQLYQINPTHHSLNGHADEKIEGTHFQSTLHHKRTLYEAFGSDSNQQSLDNIKKITSITNNQTCYPNNLQQQDQIKSEEWVTKFLNNQGNQTAQIAFNSINEMNPLKSHDEMIAQISKQQMQAESNIQKNRENSITQSDALSQNQYSCQDNQTTKTLHSPNQFSQLTIPSYSLIQENSLSPQTALQQQISNQANIQFTPQIQQNAQLNSQKQPSFPSLPSFNHIGSSISLQNINDLQQNQQCLYNQLLGQQIQQQNFPNLIQNTQITVPQNQQMNLHQQFQHNTQQQQVNIQNNYNNHDYFKNFPQQTQINLGMHNLDQILQKNKAQIYQNPTFSQDSVLQQLQNQKMLVQQNQLEQQKLMQRNNSAQIPFQLQQNVNMQNFLLNINQNMSLPDVNVQIMNMDKYKDLNQKINNQNLFNFDITSNQYLPLNNKQLNQSFSLAHHDQIQNASSQTSKNIGSNYQQNQLGQMTLNQFQQQNSLINSLKQENLTDISNHSYTDPSIAALFTQKQEAAQVIKQNPEQNFFQSKIEEYDYNQNSNVYSQKMSSSYSMIKPQQINQQLIQNFSKKEEA
ncbi:hypothetical protein TTHERM_00647040 (macronuclear) [Tetrahymena thermophila SB210]|uniref:Uncharacterized protein n=1 Tax=Tetrahymena thermophila (strain SB210) TaxID=312017 RepID=I7M4J4_TETTS|nr:hypothetical protein TTHERM_00647040 [Tetrahymena thermophila SB210]EAS07171.1 hypothetical protein TTHERM_00647040 [Tetrahymena thermophila SB210]|eukprot:XP_001027413.1 hypothetical protein TTHERM_00647040 [Tetrahymena thermophila SB210]